MFPIIWQEWHSVLPPLHSLMVRLPELQMNRQRGLHPRIKRVFGHSTHYAVLVVGGSNGDGAGAVWSRSLS